MRKGNMKNTNLVNIIDVESTCWSPPELKAFNEISEIIEIGISVIDINSLKLINNDSIIVKPQRSKVSKFCTKLTTLTQEVVDQGVSFAAAMAILNQNYDSKNRTFISWGDYDRKMFERNCKDYGIEYPFGPSHLNLKNCFTLLYGLDHELGMDAALEHLKLKLDGIHHRGNDDSKNIANIFIHSLRKFRGI